MPFEERTTRLSYAYTSTDVILKTTPRKLRELATRLEKETEETGPHAVVICEVARRSLSDTPSGSRSEVSVQIQLDRKQLAKESV